MVVKLGDEQDETVAVYDPWKKTGTQGQIINAQDGAHGLGPAAGPTLDDYEQTFHKDVRFG